MIAAVWRGGMILAVFAGGLALSCLAIASVLPLPEVPQVKEKLEWFRAHRGEYTALFLGTSRVRRHLIPSLFDKLAAERGIQTRSFNLGIDSLAAPEDGYVLDRVLEAAPARLRYVFIELSYFRANFSGQGADTIRAAYWHDWERTSLLWQQLLAEDYRRIKPLKKRKKNRWSGWIADVSAWTDSMTAHGRLFLQRASNLGRGAAWLQIALGARLGNDPLAPLGPGQDGFIPSDQEMNATTLAEYARQLAALQAQPDRSQPLAPMPQENLERMLAKVRARGAEPILFIAPTSSGVVLVPRKEVAPLFDFSDPRQWPELFEPRYRADLAHLNSAGAEAFTRALAGRFLATKEHR